MRSGRCRQLQSEIKEKAKGESSECRKRDAFARCINSVHNEILGLRETRSILELEEILT